MTANTIPNSKRIAKNTIILYVRMMAMMFIGLFTSRVVLNTLGIEDYGIYNVVGGVVAMFSIVSSSFSGAISRFLMYELGKTANKQLQHVFSTSVVVQFSLSVFLLILLETFGLWFLNYKLNIPVERLDAANFVFQVTIITFVISLNSTSYNAMIIAHERMGIYAYITLFDTVLKLVIVYLLYISSYDKLKTYSLLLMCVSIIVQCIYFIYCRKTFPESRIVFRYDKKLFKEIFNYAGWSLLGSGSWVLNTQGINLLINLFFGVTINAARAIATQVDSAIQGFVNNFTTALNPQIIKSYAENKLDYMQTLVFAGSRYSYYLFLFFAIPIFLEAHQILQWWLGIVPGYSVLLVRLTLLSTLIVVLGNSMTVAQGATGKVKTYYLVVSIITFLDLPLTYLFFKLGYPVEYAYIIYMLVYFLLLFIKIKLLSYNIGFSVKGFVSNVLVKVGMVTLLSITIPFVLYRYGNHSIMAVSMVCFSSVLCTLLSVYFVGINPMERATLNQFVKSKLKKNV